MQEQVDDQELAGLARHRVVAARPTASTDATVLGPVPAALDCPYLHLDDDGPSCLALPPAIRLARRQVEIVCAVAAHLACPRLIKADAVRVPVQIDPPPARARRGERPPREVADPGGLAAAAAALSVDQAAAAAEASTGAIHAAATAPAAGESLRAVPAEAIEPALPAETPVHAEPVHAEPIRSAAAAASAPAPPPPPAATETRSPARDAARTPSDTPRRPSRLAAAVTMARVSARKHIVLRPATAAAWLIFVGAVVLVIAILSAGGNVTLPALASPSAGVVATSPSAAPASPTLAASPSPTVSPSLSASTSPSPSPSPSAVATPSASPSPSAAPPFTPEQLALLKPCPGKPGCYQYRIVSGDNLRNVATFFGVEYPALLAANPQITNPSVIHIGDRITIPLPVPPKATPKP